MAFTDTTSRIDVNGSFTAMGNSDQTFGYAGDIFVHGTFDATVVLQAQTKSGDWVTICTFSGEGMNRFQFANVRPVRVAVTAFTSGSVDYSLEVLGDYVEAR